MAFWRDVKDKRRFSSALVEVLQSRVKLRGRPKKRQRADGFYRVEAYFSPEERQALAEIAESNSLSTSKVLRTLLRMFRAAPIDGQEDS